VHKFIVSAWYAVYQQVVVWLTVIDWTDQRRSIKLPI